jgi:two-component system response regulator YesN
VYKVVLIDDESIILGGLQRVMPWREYDCEVVATASDGLEGIAVVRETRPDILFTDIRMPNMDGLSMIAAFKSMFPRLQIAVLTAHRDFEYAQRALNLGVTRFILKPSKMDELIEALREMIARASAAPEVDEKPKDAEHEAGSFVVQLAKEYIRNHCMDRIHLQDVASHVYVSQWHLSKLINRYTGQTFNELLNEQRIERAKELLLNPSLKVYAIAEILGFSDVAHFSKTYKKLTGKTPGEYRAEKS